MPKAWNVINLRFYKLANIYVSLNFIIFLMLKAILIGNIGADAENKSSNGREFVTFRVAHSWSFTTSDGQTNAGTIWVDCIGSNLKNVLPHLKKGQQVYVEGDVSLRVYSSKLERCMKAGITINVDSVQLIGAKPELVPREVVDPEDGNLHSVKKIYIVPDMNGVVQPDEYKEMTDVHGNQFLLDCLGQIKPFANQMADDATDTEDKN